MILPNKDNAHVWGVFAALLALAIGLFVTYGLR
jgi:hypothetical protein